MAITSAPHQWAYDVFVSFRGKDISKTFMDHLFKDFWQKGIHAFRDDIELPRGENISPGLYKAIEESRFLIVIFSKNYASSSWCLRELTKILECKQIGDRKHELRIIFYDVKPDVVRKQMGSYKEAFAKHVILNSTEVAEWKEALYEAANISGQDLHDTSNGYESKFIEKISEDILRKLCCEPLHVGDNLVGVDAYVNQMDLSRFIGSGRVHMIGICGISGIGKTTLAKAIYNNMCMRFEACCFCEDVKCSSLTQVQMLLIKSIMKTTAVKISNVAEGIMVIKKRMSSKRIMLVLDDVDDHEQLEALAGSSNWFYPGSFIIFTSKDKQLLSSHKVDEIYDMKFLPHHESLELFSLYAFGKKHPAEDFEELTCQVVDHLQGHPLALKVLGRCLYKKPEFVWKSEVDRLKTYPHREIQEKLQPSFDELDFDQKRIFLDIACSFIGENKDFVASVLESDACFAYANMEVLVDKSLITISRDDNSLQMHDLIQSMARGVGHREFEEKKVKSRLWNPTEVCNVLGENKATTAEREAVEVLDLLLEESDQKVHIDMKAFRHMRNLRILKVCDHELASIWKPFELKQWKDSMVNYSGTLEFLSNKLRLLYWHGCPFKFFPSDFYPEQIVSIDLSYGHIKEIWTSPQCFGRLKVMKLKHCRNLTRTPDFTKITNLEVLNLEGCVKLAKVHSSIGMLKRLVVLNMKNCKRFKSFPCKVEWGTLEVINLSGCSKVDKLPDFLGTIQTLKEFCVDGTAITKLPSFVYSPCNLQVLRIGPHGRIQSRRWTPISQPSCLPSKIQHSRSLVIPSLVGLSFLRVLRLRNCNVLEVPNSIGGLSCLESLDLRGNDFTSLPGCLSQLFRLQDLNLSSCKKLEVLPELPHTILALFARNCTSLQELQGRVQDDQSYAHFDFTGCPKLLMNLTIDHSRMFMSQPQPINSSITAHGSINQFPSLIQYMNIPTTTHGIFFAHKRSFCSNNVDMIFHGNRIPQWFTNQSMGNHVMVELPPNWCYNKFRGYGTCTVLSPKKSSLVGLEYFVKNFDGTSLDDCGPFCYIKSWDDSLGVNESDIIWFHFSTDYWQDWSKAQNFVTFSFQDEYDNDAEVKECGVRLVCDEDIQEDLCINQYLQIAAQGGGVFQETRLDLKSRILRW